MTKCLIALGSNLGDRAAMLDDAIAALAESPGVASVRPSSWQMTLPVGGSEEQPSYLNGAAILEVSREATDLLAMLHSIETEHGRVRGERWGDRTLDLDLLLFGEAIIDKPSLTVPHPRMSFRRFVLEPAVEIAAGMVHPTIGWTLAALLDQLDSGSDSLAVVSSDELDRREFATALVKQFRLAECNRALVDSPLWPSESTTWLVLPNGDVSDAGPKLTILVGPDAGSEAGRGPTLRIGRWSDGEAWRDAAAAIEAVWPRLGPSGEERLQ
jgi:2-amino-4-hydroxy-6-hydroxymethyldihydropteridine diphosphokinase